MYLFLMEVTKQAISAGFKQGSQRRSISKIFCKMIKILLNYTEPIHTQICAKWSKLSWMELWVPGSSF